MTTPPSARITLRIAERLRVTAFERHITQGAIASAAGISRSAVNEYLNGRKDIPLSTFIAICSTLNVDSSVLLDEVQSEFSD